MAACILEMENRTFFMLILLSFQMGFGKELVPMITYRFGHER